MVQVLVSQYWYQTRGNHPVMSMYNQSMRNTRNLGFAMKIPEFLGQVCWHLLMIRSPSAQSFLLFFFLWLNTCSTSVLPPPKMIQLDFWICVICMLESPAQLYIVFWGLRQFETQIISRKIWVFELFLQILSGQGCWITLGPAGSSPLYHSQKVIGSLWL